MNSQDTSALNEEMAREGRTQDQSPCEAYASSGGFMFCPRCHTTWTAFVHNTGWLPDACVRKLPNASSE